MEKVNAEGGSGKIKHEADFGPGETFFLEH